MTEEELAVIEARANTPTFWRDQTDAFLAHARQDIPALVAEVRRLREAIMPFAYHASHKDAAIPDGTFVASSFPIEALRRATLIADELESPTTAPTVKESLTVTTPRHGVSYADMDRRNFLRAFGINQMILKHPEMSRAEVTRIVDEAIAADEAEKEMKR